MTDPLLDIEQIDCAIADALGDACDCQRVWSAWSVGTMGAEDFVRVAGDPERIAEIREAALGPVKEVIEHLSAGVLALSPETVLAEQKALLDRIEALERRETILHEALSAAMIYVCAHADDATIVLCGDALHDAKEDAPIETASASNVVPIRPFRTPPR